MRMSWMRTLLAGRWQIPTAILAVVCAAVALHRIRPTPVPLDESAALADLHVLHAAAKYHDAANAAANLLERQPPPSRETQIALRLFLARLTHEVEKKRQTPIAENARRYFEHRDAAVRLGGALTPADDLDAAEAREWAGELPEAIAEYQTLLTPQTPAETRVAALRALVRILEARPAAESQRREYIEALLSEESVSPAYAWWTLQAAIESELDRGDAERARELLPRYGQRFLRSDLRGYYDYITAWLDVVDGRLAEALPLVEQIDQWLASHTLLDEELHRAGFLPAMNRWLRGRIELAEFRPQQALASFRQAMELEPTTRMALVAALGRAEALALLERHETARSELREALRRAGQRAPLAVLARVRRTLESLFNERHEAGDRRNAIAYIELALETTPAAASDAVLLMLERLAREHQDAAREALDAGWADAAHEHGVAAARAYDRASALLDADRDRLGAMLWTGAQEYDRAGLPGDARRLLERFVRDFEGDARLPRAYVLLGETSAAIGDLDAAIGWYKTLLARHPALEESLRGRHALAECYIAAGQAHEAQAETILLELLEDERITPAARAYRDALRTLCDLLLAQERFADAIGRIDEFLGLYPADEDRQSMRFLLADAYRRSAYALRAGLPGVAADAGFAESRQRFRTAARLFGELVRETTADHEPDEEREVHDRLALFYAGDCLFELNEPGTLDEAVGLYRLASSRYPDDPSSLSAQVQIAIIQLRRGRSMDAVRAIERARWLLRGMPDDAFSTSPGHMDRAAWSRYLDSVAASHLMRDVFAASQ